MRLACVVAIGGYTADDLAAKRDRHSKKAYPTNERVLKLLAQMR